LRLSTANLRAKSQSINIAEQIAKITLCKSWSVDILFGLGVFLGFRKKEYCSRVKYICNTGLPAIGLKNHVREMVSFTFEKNK
jgi:hypothetical protein